MNKLLPGAVAAGLLMVSTAWAGNGHAVPTLQSSASLSAAQQAVVRQKAEVKRLQQHVAAQEVRSRQAGQHLQQQDQTIAALRQQLQKLQARPAGGVAE